MRSTAAGLVIAFRIGSIGLASAAPQDAPPAQMTHTATATLTLRSPESGIEAQSLEVGDYLLGLD